MERGAIRRLAWVKQDSRLRADAQRTERVDAIAATLSIDAPAPSDGFDEGEYPVLDPPPTSAEEEAIALLRIAAEIEGALLAQYLFSAGSLLPEVSADIPGFDHPVLSDDWYDLTREIAKQEMGHLITVQNLLLSLGAMPHVDRENFPIDSALYPFPFSLRPIRSDTLARYVCAEAPHEVAPADLADYEDATVKAGARIDDIPRAGQIYERLFWLLQDDDTPQEPWPDLDNPFPSWPDWRVDPAKIGLNQDRQGDAVGWRGDGDQAPADTAIYVLEVRDKASARIAVHRVGAQGEGPLGQQGSTHFDKFLRLYREQRGVAQQAGAPAFVRNQADDPRTGLGGPATITDPKTLIWAKLGNVRYQMLLMDIALSLSVGPTGSAAGTMATRQNFLNWAFSEMMIALKHLAIELRQMPLLSGAGPDELRAGLPYELPAASLPADIPGQVGLLRTLLAESSDLRTQIAAAFNPTPKQKNVLAAIQGVDDAIAASLGQRPFQQHEDGDMARERKRKPSAKSAKQASAGSNKGTVYKIHPAIGVARVGDSDTFFVGPETADSPGVEISGEGSEAPVALYKDGGRVKRQAARFRVFKFLQDETGQLELVGEVTADEATIEWRVDLCNRKAALPAGPGSGHPASGRNLGVADRDTLIIRSPRPVAIAGKSQPAAAFNGEFLGKPVYLGELRTDSKGRLLVLGGHGHSSSVPDGEPLGDWANNDKWHDDVADGPVTALITLPGQEPVVAHHPSWVVVGPPDFAPGVGSIVTLYDVAFQAAVDKGALSPDPKPSFRRHIKPMIERAGALRWVNNYTRWTPIATADLTQLADPSPAHSAARLAIAQRLKAPGLAQFIMPTFMKTYLEQWVAGDFISDLSAAPLDPVSPEGLDRAPLDACVGNNFFPGIEASINLMDKDIYARPFRLDHTNLGKVYPGCMTELMALPWQADFYACDDGVWWPSQRPDFAMTDADNIPASKAGWVEPISDYQGMVDDAMKLGFVVATTNAAGETVVVEQERGLPRAALVADAGGAGGVALGEA